MYIFQTIIFTQGPNHNSLKLDVEELTVLTVYVEYNNTSHQITMKDPRSPDLER